MNDQFLDKNISKRLLSSNGGGFFSDMDDSVGKDSRCNKDNSNNSRSRVRRSYDGSAKSMRR